MPTAAGAAETSATSGPDMLIPTQPESDSLSTVTPQPSGPIIPDDPPLTIPSEWNDAEVQSEKWATKQTFEDPDGPIRLPPTAVLLADWAAIKVEYRRPVDFLGAEAPVMVQPVAVQEELFRSPALGGDERQRPGAVRGGVATAAGSPGSRAASARQLAGGNASARASADVGAVQQEAGEAQQDAGDAQVEADVNGSEAIAAVADAATGEALPEGPLEASSKDANRTVEAHHVPAANNWTSFSKYIQHNQHLMASPLYRHLILYFQATFEQGKLCKAAGSQNPTDEFTPWEHIYPKGKDGLPVYNPSGKYYVRLHWMGAWRKVVIDDRIPFAGGKPLLLSSPVTNELWPLLLTKALLKLAVFSYNYVDHAQEYGDFNALRCISGWLVEPITLSANPSAAFIGTLVNLSSRILSIPTPQQAGTPAETSHATLPTGKVAPITKSPSKERVNNGGLSLRDSVSIYAIGNGGEDSTAVMTYASWPHRVMEMVEDEGALFVRVRSVFQPDGHNVSDPWISYADFVKSFRRLVVIQSPASFKFTKTLLHLSDASKPADTYANDSYVVQFPASANDETGSGAVIVLSSAGTTRTSLAQKLTAHVVTFDWKERSVIRPIATATTTGVTVLHVPRPKADSPRTFQLIVDSYAPYGVQLFSKDEVLLFEEESTFSDASILPPIKDFEDVHASLTPGVVSVLFKTTFKVVQESQISAQLFVSDTLAACTNLRVVDNDTREELSQLYLRMRQQIVKPNEKGYTILADCKPIVAHPAAKFKLRVFGTPLPEFTSDLSVKPNVVELEEAYVQNKHALLFRNVLKVKDGSDNMASFHLQFSVPFTHIRFQVFMNDVEVLREESKNGIFVPAILLSKSDEPAAPASAGKKSAVVAAPPPTSVPKVRYIIQASITNTDHLAMLPEQLTMLPQSDTRPPMSASSVRPTSGAQTPSTEKTRRLTSGDKKKAASRLDAINERKWKLRVISSGTSSVLLAKDTEREERLKALKEGWEIANPGRLVRAKELRDNYNRGEGIGASTIGVCIKVRETVTSVGGMTTSLSNVYGVGKTMPSRGGSRNALVTSGSSSIIGNQPRVLNETDLAAREESRNQRAQQYQTLIAAVRRDRLRDKETRAQLKSQQFQPLEQLAQEAERYNREDDTRRLAYRKYMRELEEEARARKLAELAAESAAAEAALPTVVEEDKSKKKGKK